MTKMKSAVRPKYIAASTIDAINSIIHEAHQPVTVNEIYTRYAQTGGKLSRFTVVKALDQLVSESRVAGRLETADERYLREGGVPTKGSYSTLYWAGQTVPERRMGDGALPGVTRDVVAVALARYRASKNRSYKNRVTRLAKPRVQTGRPASAPAVQTGNRIDRLEHEVAELKKLVASLVKALG